MAQAGSQMFRAALDELGAVLARVDERHDFKPGDMLRLRPRLDHVHLFDAGTGKRL